MLAHAAGLAAILTMHHGVWLKVAQGRVQWPAATATGPYWSLANLHAGASQHSASSAGDSPNLLAVLLQDKRAAPAMDRLPPTLFCAPQPLPNC